MQVDYIYDGTVLTSKPKHVGHAGERELLLAMFEATGGKSFVDPIELKKLGKEPKSNWRKTGGWDPAVEPSWHHEYMFAYHGLKLREDGHVEQILLTANGLVLTLPGRMLRGLPGLKVLDLSDNDLQGGVPPEAAFLAWPNLTHLVLSDNPRLGGSLPASLPQTSKFLEVVQLYNCGLAGCLPPAFLSQLPHLKKVLLHDNKLTGCSPVGIFSGEEVDAKQQSLALGTAMAVARGASKLKSKLKSKPKAKVKAAQAPAQAQATTPGAAPGAAAPVASDPSDPSGGGLGLDPTAAELRAWHRTLSRLTLHGNQFQGPVGELSAMLKLKLRDLSLGNNRFTGPMTPLLERWADAKDQRVSLRTLALDRNLLTGPLPHNLNAVRYTLTNLNLSHNKLEGSLDGRTLAALSVLEKLALSHNHFTGALPESLSSLSTSLEHLVLGHNHLSGPVPTGALACLTRLRTLDLQHNRLAGPIDGFFQGMTELRELNLGFNELSGPMPIAAFGSFQRAKPPGRRLRTLVMQPNPRMVQPSEQDLVDLRKDLPNSNITIAWKNYTF